MNRLIEITFTIYFPSSYHNGIYILTDIPDKILVFDGVFSFFT